MRTKFPIVFSLFIAASLATPAFTQSQAQGESAAGQQPTTTDARPAAAVSVRHDIPPMGVTVYLPEGAIAELTSFQGTRSKTVIRDPDNTWVIQIYDDVESADATIDEVIDAFIQKQRQAVLAVDPKTGQRMAHEVVGRKRADGELVIAGQNAGRFYSAVPNTDLQITGFTVFEPQPGRFVVFQLDVTRALYQEVVPLYETIVASASFVDPTAAKADLTAARLTAEAFLDGITSRDLEEVLPAGPTFIRISRPTRSGSPADATEIAYQKIEIKLGQLGELRPERPRTAWQQADREVGFVARIDARYVQGAAEILSRGVFFLSRDRDTEMWNVTNVVKEAGDALTVTQTFVREGNRLTVTTDDQTGTPRTSDWNLDKIRPVYISRIELLLLPYLVANTVEEPGSPAYFDLAFYTYEPQVERLTVRRDIFRTVPAGGWTYTSKPHMNAEDVVATIDADGELVRRQLSEGMVAERSTASRIRELWQRKGLLDR